jgi:nucleoside-diphosphate-sugar epimerase
MMYQSTWKLILVGILFCEQVTAFSLQMSAGKTNVIAGATGYIGKSVVRESVRQGYKTIALVRDKKKVESKEGKALYGQFFEGAEVVECDVSDPAQLTKVGHGFHEAPLSDVNLLYTLRMSHMVSSTFQIFSLWKKLRLHPVKSNL